MTRTAPGRPPAGTARQDVVQAAQRATYVAFLGSGFGFASWASRIPALRDALHASPSTLGLVLLSVALGSLVALPLSGAVVTRLGTARTVALTAGCVAAGLLVVALGYTSGIPVVTVGLFLIGFGNGTWDVAMNVEGAAVEQRLGRAVMPRFHAGYSIGAVAGALGGSGAVALGVPVAPHLIAAAAVMAGTVVPFTRRFLPVLRTAAAHPTAGSAASGSLAAWAEPRTLLVGLFVLCMAFTEGTANDWLAVAVIDGYDAPAVAGPLTLAVFLAAMTSGRWFGPQLLDRFGRVTMVRGSAVLALVGLLLVVVGAFLPLVLAGAVCWGLGAALGFPVGMSAAADDPQRAAARVSVVSSIGYTAFLAGPPLIGLLADHAGVLHALTLAAALLALAVLLAGATAPLPADLVPAEGPGEQTVRVPSRDRDA